MIWDVQNEQMKDELVTFEERSCPRIPGDMSQYKIDNYRKGSERDLHYFVHGIVTDSVDDSHKQNERNGPSVVEVSRGMKTEANTNEKPKDDHYPMPLKKSENIIPACRLWKKKSRRGKVKPVWLARTKGLTTW